MACSAGLWYLHVELIQYYFDCRSNIYFDNELHYAYYLSRPGNRNRKQLANKTRLFKQWAVLLNFITFAIKISRNHVITDSISCNLCYYILIHLVLFMSQLKTYP
jgi:hypothetical protein